jgi:hypothetical protein
VLATLPRWWGTPGTCWAAATTSRVSAERIVFLRLADRVQSDVVCVGSRCNMIREEGCMVGTSGVRPWFFTGRPQPVSSGSMLQEDVLEVYKGLRFSHPKPHACPHGPHCLAFCNPRQPPTEH